MVLEAHLHVQLADSSKPTSHPYTEGCTWPQKRAEACYGVEEGVRHYGVIAGLCPECGPEAVLDLVHRHSTG